ncbi:MAG: ABC transporter ATP-binding protein [Halobacteriovoraceae bacterium]|nr:ABC transporter ATP-binding protein [Halobacteriovoraceae bacterium]
MKTPILELENITHFFSNKFTFKGVNLQLFPGEIVSILGKSGEGKSTLLNCIAGFLPIVEGKIKINGNIISEKGYSLCPEERDVGMVFQDASLFPHLTVRENIAFALRKDKKKITDQILNLMNIEYLKDKYPHQISGGEQQRTALARSLARFPPLLLLDEAFSHLDVHTKEYLMGEFHRILKKLKVSVIHITHDFKEAFAFSDRVAVMANGKFTQVSTPWDIYHFPKSEDVLSLLGAYHIVDACVISKGPLKLSSIIGSFVYEENISISNQPRLIIRPENFIIKKDGDKEGEVGEVKFLGSHREYVIYYRGVKVPAHDHGDNMDVRPGDKVRFAVAKRPSLL